MVTSSHLLPHTLAAPGLARRHLRSMSAGWHPDVAGTAELLLSELVTNAVLHGLGPVDLVLHDDGALVRVEVTDRDLTPLSAPTAGPPGVRTGGRGLFIVQRMAPRWGCLLSDDPPPRKTVWFELPR